MKLVLVVIVLLLFQSICFAENPIVKNAIAELGNGETERNNAGFAVRIYTRGDNVAWCAGFVSYILEKSNVKLFKYSLSVKEIYNEAKRKGRLTDNPQAGDLIVFNAANPKNWQGHIGIVEKVDDTYVHTIEGNSGRFPAVVMRKKYEKTNIERLLGYIKTEENRSF
jgi:hypothetical protein